MNLDIGILWIEDFFSPEEYASLKRRVHDAGFVARIKNLKNGEGIESESKEHLLFHRFDLILLDYKLKNENGDDLAPKIRELFPSTTILFYSGNFTKESDLRHLIAEKEVEGVFCCHRSRFIERTGALIDQTARSLDRLSGMRGLAMRVVAECDDIMKSAVLSMNEREPDCLGKLTNLDADVVGFLEHVRAAYKEAESGSLDDRLRSRAVDSSKLYKHFRRLTKIATGKPAAFGLSVEETDRLRELRRITAHYDPEVLQKRNALGHVTEEETPEGLKLRGSGGIQVSDFPALRQTFASHIGAFSEMRELVCRLDTQEAK